VTIVDTRIESSSVIALWLAGIWDLHKSSAFADYVAKTYHKRVVRLPSFECVYIAEAESGDFETGAIGGIIRKWWKVDDAGLTEIRRPQLSTTDQPALFDRRPVLKFFTSGGRIVVGERLGPDLICRRVETLLPQEASFRVADVRLLWATSETDKIL
jgi:hypothetical protein